MDFLGWQPGGGVVWPNPAGFALMGLLPSPLKACPPPGLTLTELGYQPVGIKPATFPVSFSSLSTANAFVPPWVTYNVRSSGESARLFGLLPLNPRGFRNTSLGAVTGNCEISRSLSVSTIATESLLSQAT